ncbi:hypothetical protein RRG08_042606 [Elysia crispata]|uniref:Uncharacterized protein n=1 Tax=Elysia crispata TaxID=231223 RepID=A0AAE0XQ19_9GAST|nr:hypothetical protein RRG08_042606 [Elysia crispata]
MSRCTVGTHQERFVRFPLVAAPRSRMQRIMRRDLWRSLADTVGRLARKTEMALPEVLVECWRMRVIRCIIAFEYSVCNILLFYKLVLWRLS